MNSYLKLVYILKCNYLITILEKSPLRMTETELSCKKGTSTMRILFAGYWLATALLGCLLYQLVCLAALRAGFGICKIDVAVRETYYPMVLLLEFFLFNLAKPKLFRAKEQDDCLIRIYKMPSKQYVRTKRVITCGMAVLETAVYVGMLFWLELRGLVLLQTGLALLIAGISANLMAEGMVRLSEKRYLQFRMTLMMIGVLGAPIISFLIAYGGIRLDLAADGLLVPEMFLLGSLLLLFFFSGNERQIAQLIERIYVQENDLLVSMNEETIDQKQEAKLGERPKGLAYLDALFFQRHRKLVRSDLAQKLIVVALAAVCLCVMKLEGKERYILSAIPLLSYELSCSRRLCRAFYMNCDREMGCHLFFRSRKTKSVLFRLRLRSLLRLNLLYGGSALALFGVIYHMLWRNTFYCTEWGMGILVILLLVMHCVFDLVWYTKTEPYTEDGKIRTIRGYRDRWAYLLVLSAIGMIL